MEGGNAAVDLNEQLEYLYAILSDNPEDEEQFPPELLCRLCDSIKENEGKRLALKGSGLKQRVGDREVKRLVRGLIRANIQLDEISLPYHRITDDGFDYIVQLMNPASYVEADEKNCQSVRAVNLEGNEIQGETLASGILMSAYDCSLRSLDLSGNPLSSSGQINMSEMLAHNRTIYHVAISSCGFNLQGFIHLTSNLNDNQTLESLILDRPLLSDYRQGEVLERLSKILECNRSLRALSLKYHDCMDHDAKLFANILYTNHCLVHLNLECNKIGVAGAEALASSLLYCGNNGLQFLGLSHNFVSNDGAIALAEAIRVNTGLKVLTLKNNSIGPVGLEALANALESASNLESLTIFGNKFDNNNGIHFHRLIAHRLPYTHIFLDIEVYIVDNQYMIAEVPVN